MAKPSRRSLVAPVAQTKMEPEMPQRLQAEPPTVRRTKKRSDLSMKTWQNKHFIYFLSFVLALASVVIIQTWFRRRRALFEMRRKTAWTIYQNIEYAGEQDQLKVCIYLNIIFRMFFLFSCIISLLNSCKL